MESLLVLVLYMWIHLLIVKMMITKKYIIYCFTIKEKINVNAAPPRYPYHVFLGDSAINWCLPKKYPTIYANISLHTIKNAGIINQINPSYILWIMSHPWTDTNKVAITIHPNNLNWYLRYPCFKLNTNPKKPTIIIIKQIKLW